MGLEPTTPCLQSRCSSQLSYVPGIVLRPANDPQNPVHHDGTAHDEQNDLPPRACPALSTTDERSSGVRPADVRTLRRALRTFSDGAGDGVVRFVGETVVGLLVYGVLMGMRRRSRRRGLMVGAAAGAAVAHHRARKETSEPAAASSPERAGAIRTALPPTRRTSSNTSHSCTHRACSPTRSSRRPRRRSSGPEVTSACRADRSVRMTTGQAGCNE